MSAEIIAIGFVALAVRSIISMNSYSGYHKAPMFGDYEAQRHWQEVTLNSQVNLWYTNGTHNDLKYWGLDYPPLTAYHSYLMGCVADVVNHSYVELHKSRGIESKDHKSFMRLTVLAADIFLLIPAVLLISLSIDRIFKRNVKRQLFLLFAIYPGQVLIDNGHFQYNNISLGFAILAVAAVLTNRNYLAAFTFTLAVNYKQMELYHALPFFAYLLSFCVSQKSFRSFLKDFTIITTVVLATFAILWYPWLNSVAATSQVLRRLFPLARGVFEDKVANFWCSLNVIYKLKTHIDNDKMALICLATTLMAALPGNMYLFMRRSKISFLLALFNTAAAFFLFSFQVHEKTVLLIAFPSICLFPWWAEEMLWFLEMSVFSMMPLLKKDNLLVPTAALMLIFNLTFESRLCKTQEVDKVQRNLTRTARQSSEVLMLFVMLAFLLVEPPSRYPDTWPLIISVISCGHILMFLLWGYAQQLNKNNNDNKEF